MYSNDPLYSMITIPENREFQVKRFTRKNEEYWNIRNHYHDIYEIVLYDQIHGYANLNGEKKRISRKTLLYLPPYAVHGFDLAPNINTYTVLHLSPLFLNRKEESITPPTSPGVLKIDEEDHDMITRLLLWGKDKKQANRIRREAVVMILIWLLEKDPQFKSVKKQTENFTRLLKIIDKEKNYNIRLTEAAQLCNMSRSSFCEHFRTQFGTSFNNFLQEKRIEDAQHLLIYSCKSCTEIAVDLEFSDASHFSKLFKKYTGMLPGDFKKSFTT